jgi:hypothetical protein
MPIIIRRARQGDAPECGRITFEAFQALADEHGFPRDFPSGDADDADEYRPLHRTDWAISTINPVLRIKRQRSRLAGYFHIKPSAAIPVPPATGQHCSHRPSHDTNLV